MTPFERLIEDIGHAFASGDPEAAAREVESGNVRLIQEIFAAIGRGDYEAALAHVTDDMVLTITGPTGHPFNGRWAGKAEVRAAIDRNFAMVEDQWVEIRSVVAQGETVVLIARERGRYRPSGQEYEAELAQVYGFRGGKLQTIREVFSAANPPL
jgi:ketosteroid isomerase-like protein